MGFGCLELLWGDKVAEYFRVHAANAVGLPGAGFSLYMVAQAVVARWGKGCNCRHCSRSSSRRLHRALMVLHGGVYQV